MDLGYTRGLMARILAIIGFLCGAIGLLAGLQDRILKLAPWGWFTGGMLLLLIALYLMFDGAIAYMKFRVLVVDKTTEFR